MLHSLRIPSLVVLAAGLTLAGCSSSPPYAAPRIDNPAEQENAVVLASEDLADLVQVGSPVVERLPESGLLRVQIPVRNVGDDPLDVLCTMEFMNAELQPISDITSSYYMRIPAGMTKGFEAVSTKEIATDFVLRIRENKQ